MADPTVTDVFNQLVQVNANLDQVEVNTSLISNLNATLNAGFSATVGRLDTIAAIEVEAVKLLFHLTKQNEVIICALEHISRNTCELVNQATTQTELQSEMADDISTVRFLVESTAPAAALEHRRLEEIQEDLERCCPPEKPRPPCDYEPCRGDPGPAKEPELPKRDDGHERGPN